MAAANQVVTLKSVTNERVVVLLSRLVQFTCCKETFTVLLILVSRKFFYEYRAEEERLIHVVNRARMTRSLENAP